MTTKNTDDLASGNVTVGSKFWMHVIVDNEKYPEAGRDFASAIGEEVDWIAPRPDNNFKECQLNGNTAMEKLYISYEEKENIFDF